MLDMRKITYKRIIKNSIKQLIIQGTIKNLKLLRDRYKNKKNCFFIEKLYITEIC